MSAVSGLEDAVAESLAAALPGASSTARGTSCGRGAAAPRCAWRSARWTSWATSWARSWPDGYLTLRRVGITPAGPLFDQALEGERVTVFGRRGPVAGVVGVRSIHLARGRPTASEEPFSLDNAYVDVGASSAAEVAQLGVAVLAPVTRAKAAQHYGLDLVAAPDVSARAACAALLDAALRPAPGSPSGTAVVAFTRRRHFRWDGAAYLLAERAPRGADVVVLGDAGPADSLDLGAAPARRDSLPAGEGWREGVAWSLPTRYAGTSVETISLRDVAALADRLRQFLAGAPVRTVGGGGPARRRSWRSPPDRRRPGAPPPRTPRASRRPATCSAG